MTGQIYELIPKITKAIGAIGKDSKNNAQGYFFRGIEAIMAGTHDPLADNGVFPVPEVFDVEQVERQSSKGGALFTTTLKMKVTFYAPDGSSVSAVTAGEAMDSADKSSNKAMSAAYKYALVLTFNIPTELDEADFETPEVQPQSAKPPKKIDERKRDDFNNWVKPYVDAKYLTPERVRELVKQANGDYGEAGRLCTLEMQPKDQ